jgi:hypothetical protein
MDLPEGEPDAMSHPMVQKLFHNAVKWLTAPAAAL